MLAINNNIIYLHFQRQLLVEAWEFDGDDIIDRITIPMMEIGNKCLPSNTHTISGELGIGIFTLIYFNLTTEPTTSTSTYTTTIKSIVTSTLTDSTTLTSTPTESNTITTTTTDNTTVTSTTTDSTTVTSTTTDSAIVTSTTRNSNRVISTTTVNFTVFGTFSSTEEGKIQTYTYNYVVFRVINIIKFGF